MAVGLLMIGFFNYKTTIVSRVTLLRPTLIANDIALLSTLISIAVIRIPLLA